MALKIDRNELDRIKVIFSGAPLNEDEAVRSQAHDNVTVLAVVAPRPPPPSHSLVRGRGNEDEDEDEELRVNYDSLPSWQRPIVDFMRNRLRIPDPVVALCLMPTRRFWMVLFGWIAGWKFASVHGWGAVYLVSTIFVVIVFNLGTRSDGELSAYSIFNEGFRRLPGQLTAEDLDRQMRRRYL